ncbi:MAG: methylenetetrahydrofolate reductase [Candidatus Saccharimonadaceae bacterium]
MQVSELIKNRKGKTAFSFELLPPLKGNSIQQVFNVVDRLKEFDPKYINITTHHSENIYIKNEDGSLRKRNIRKRPGSVAIAAAIQNRYGITAVPHMISKGFTKEETEYALLDLSFLGVHDLLLLRGDTSKLDADQLTMDSHNYATGLQAQVNNFNKGISYDGSAFDAPEVPFSYGMACYPELHVESLNMESELYYIKKKVENGADYLVTQMFFDNDKYFKFVELCRKENIQIPIIPGIKPIHTKNQLTILPQIFRSEIPVDLASELEACKNDEEAKEIGVRWCIQQCRELISHDVPSLHFYSYMASESVCKIAKAVY